MINLAEESETCTARPTTLFIEPKQVLLADKSPNIRQFDSYTHTHTRGYRTGTHVVHKYMRRNLFADIQK